MKEKLPNFLIVGTLKAGTTSLYNYLKQHPQVYMSHIKEPRFLTNIYSGMPQHMKKEKQIVDNIKDYKKLFENVTNEKAIGEASTGCLYYYEEAIENIKHYLGDVKIIIILRDPTERAFSSFQMVVRNRRENLSFEDALNAEDERKNSNFMDGCGWQYKSVGFYYNQVKAYLENFSQVRIYLYDDLRRDPLSVMKDIYEFLEVDKLFIPDTGFEYNVGGVPKNKFIQYFLVKSLKFKTHVEPIFKCLKMEEWVYKLIHALREKNLKKHKMNPKTREYLKNVFREDILKLQELINRDLSKWLM
ncbi:MAG: sulfotransferase [Candidatus Brocadiaceae bacterium]|nr:sulfotransferase [Candidatus Brocadiaceae bacterium]